MAGQQPRQPELASYKRIILCSDGTWLASDMGDKSVPSNVARLARTIANSGPDKNGKIVNQIVMYQSGLGSGDFPFQKSINGALGWGLDKDVCQMYDFISNNYRPGKPGDPNEPADELLFFGFSRGAFTVRSVAGLVCDIGVLSAVHMSCFPEMWKEYRANTSGKSFRDSKWYQENKEKLSLTDVKVKVVGVWDTVGALGIPEWPVVSFAKKFLPINDKYAFHNTNALKNVEHAFQALAIDENRLPFTPALWHKSPDNETEVLQCWFPGTHSNIGGGQKEALEEIAYLTFAWMLDNLSEMLTFEEVPIKNLVEEHSRALKAIRITEESTNSWGCGPLVNNYSGLGYLWRLLGVKNRTPGAYVQDPGNGTGGATAECFHPITRIRKEKVKYKPASLEGFYTVKTGQKGWQWKGGKLPLPEWQMSQGKTLSIANENGGSVKYGRTKKSLSEKLAEGVSDDEEDGWMESAILAWL